ncbi:MULTISPECIES: very short patch repair endonuclease [Halomonadaceae]|uniref:very short patch repair endonuclease n=1 Tax=Halomonadaceae TaxID=28256 RepID=UPI0030EED37D
MVDIKNRDQRSHNMSAIRGKDTKPEMLVRRYLHSCGYRFRLHRKDLPGKPDLVMPKYQLVIFVHGCFWHRHENCRYSTTPSNRSEFWQEKFAKNVERDSRNREALLESGWRVLIIWECGLKHAKDELPELSRLIENNTGFQVWPATPPKPRALSNVIQKRG